MIRVLNCLTVEHDLRLVAVAALVCLLASVTAINLVHRARETRGGTRAAWVAAAGAAAGCGIWATHFIAMLAYDPGVSMAYDIQLTALSLAVAVTITAIGLGIAVYSASRIGAALGGAIVGSGVAAMHYLGMLAIDVPGRIVWSADLIVASIALAVLLGMASMAVATRSATRLATAGAAILLTLAIVSLHFTAMGAVGIVLDPLHAIAPYSIPPRALAVAVASAAFAILGLTFIGAFAERLLERKSVVLTTALNNMSQGLVMFDKSERLVVCNARYIEMYGLSPSVVRPGCSLRDVILHRIALGSLDRDPEHYRAELVAAMARGETVSRIVENADGRAISVINRPIEGGAFWVGTHEDITDRRRAERQGVSLAEQEQRRAAVDAAIQAFRESMNAVLKTVGDSAASMRSTATMLAQTSGETTREASGAVGTSNDASASVGAASGAARELFNSISEISHQLGRATELVGTAVAEAQSTNDEISRLARAAQEIGDVVNLIKHIAGQTNLLALNATIEAARAGESGKGFAVVASEVKSLAVQTAKATEQIAAQIAAIQASTGGAVQAIHRNTERMQEINRHTSAIAASVAQQNAATDEISKNVASAAAGTMAIVHALESVTGAVNRMGGSADTVISASQVVEEAASDLRQTVETFLRKVAA